jgi:hypothetical protein
VFLSLSICDFVTSQKVRTLTSTPHFVTNRPRQGYKSQTGVYCTYIVIRMAIIKNKQQFVWLEDPKLSTVQEDSSQKKRTL